MACMALVSSVSQLHSLYAGRQGDHDGIGLGYALPFKLPLALTSPQWANFHGCPTRSFKFAFVHPTGSDVGVNSSLRGDDPGPGRELEAAVTATQAVRVAGTGSASY